MNEYDRKFVNHKRLLIANLKPSHLAVNVCPDPLHVVPVGDDAVLHRIPDAQQSAVIFGLWSHEEVAFQRASHNADVLWSSHTEEGRECEVLNEQLSEECREKM